MKYLKKLKKIRFNEFRRLEDYLVILIFLSFIFSNFFTYNFHIFKYSLFDVLILLGLPFLLKNISSLSNSNFQKIFICLFVYLFLRLIFDLVYNYEELDEFIITKKILLFGQFVRSSLIFLIFYLILLKKEHFTKLIIDIFTIYSILIIAIYVFDIVSGFSIVTMRSEDIRLRGFFRDPNFLSMFSTYFLLFTLILRLNKTYIILFGFVTLLTYSKTAFVCLIILIIYFSFINFQDLKKKIGFEKQLLFSVIIILFIFLSYIIFDMILYNLYVGEYIPKTRFYTFFDLFSQSRFIMLKDFLAQDINLVFGEGFYSITNYSMQKYNNFSHNSFMDIYFDFGLIGLYLCIYLYFKVLYFKIKIENINYVFFIFLKLIITTIYLFNFSIIYLPYIWFFMAISSTLILKTNYFKTIRV